MKEILQPFALLFSESNIHIVTLLIIKLGKIPKQIRIFGLQFECKEVGSRPQTDYLLYLQIRRESMWLPFGIRVHFMSFCSRTFQSKFNQYNTSMCV